MPGFHDELQKIKIIKNLPPYSKGMTPYLEAKVYMVLLKYFILEQSPLNKLSVQ